MKLEVKTSESKQKVLIVSKNKFPFIQILKEEVGRLGSDVYYSPVSPKNISQYDYCFFVNENSYKFSKKHGEKHSRLIYIFVDKEKNSEKMADQKIPNVKIISIQGEIITQDQVDKILWYSFSHTNEPILKMLGKHIDPKTKIKLLRPSYNLKKIFSKKRLFFFTALAVIFVHILFIFPLAATSFFTYRTYSDIKKENYLQASNNLKQQQSFLLLTKKTYSLSQPTLLFLSLANLPDNLIEINDKIGQIFDKVLVNQKGVKELISLILNKNKSVSEKELLSLRFSNIKNDLQDIEENLTIISNKLPAFVPKSESMKKNLILGLEAITQVKKLIPFLDDVLAKDTEKKYLLLFANNMELRPGGGFIGSFGILTTKNYSLQDIKIYDVYDADGQLIAHIEPPAPIREFLGQPHWFLRDSAFSPDFLENFAQAKFFLEKEMKMSGFSGAVLITTTAIENILDGFGNIYLPEFKEVINKKNFYLKTQYYSEKNFFPGSIQKKSFLSSLMTQIMINLENASAKDLLMNIKKSFDEKQMVAYFENPKLQEILESLFWSGRIIEPKCARDTENCIVDYLLPVDANLGVNKANFYINRLITLKTNFDSNGSINHVLSVSFHNEAVSDVFPGGRYKNYFQVYLPKNTVIKTITNNGTLVEDSQITNEVKNDMFRTIGFLLDVPAKSTTEVQINYQLDTSFKRGKGVYQLIVQKQIGSSNNDLVLEMNLAKNYYLVNQNFIPLVKDNQILYNTYLSADKIFFTELIRE